MMYARNNNLKLQQVLNETAIVVELEGIDLFVLHQFDEGRHRIEGLLAFLV